MAEGMTEATGVREEIDRHVAGRTLVDLFRETCAGHGDQLALLDRPASGAGAGDDGWRRQTWRDYHDRASEIALGLRELGVGHGDVVALMMTNRPEHVIADVGAMLAGATPVSVYNTLAPEQLTHVAGNCGAMVAIVDEDVLDRWQSVRGDLPALVHLVVVPEDGATPTDEHGPGEVSWSRLAASGADRLAAHPEELATAAGAVRPEDPATIIYTSGTTGPPKGVALTHHNLMWQLHALAQILELERGLRGVSYLPLAHVAERMTTHYRAIQFAGTVYFAREIAQVAETLRAARPHGFMAVPRVWEKVHAGLLARLEAEPNARRRDLALKAIEVGKGVVRARREGRTPALTARLQYQLFDRLVYAKIREGVGLDECRYPISGAAPISEDLLTFFAALGLEILEVYGMTESTAVITANRPGRVKIGTVGEPVPGTEVRIADDGEVMARGPHVFPGYWQRDEATAETVDTDGWLHTGDLGAMDAEGYLTIIGRKKELIITAGGKNLSPNNIEETIKQQSPIIAQLCAVGDDRPFITALVVLDAEALPGWCERRGIPAASVAELAEHPDVKAEVFRAIEAGNEHLARVEQVRKVAILPNEWTAESEELTPSLKLKRTVIHAKYQDVVDTLYA